jgi:hypothetical protein
MKRTPLHAALKRTQLRTALALVLLAPAAAFAQTQFDAVDLIPWPVLGRFPAYPPEPPRPTEVYVRAGVLRDNNIFRFADGVNRRDLLGNSDNPADEVLRVGAGIRHEFLVTGRQRLRLAASGDQYSYHRNTILNHVDYGLRGEWLWEVTNDLSGAVGYERRHRLVDLAQLQRPVKDMITEDHGFVNGAYRLGPSIRLRGAVDGTKASRSDSATAFRDTRALTVLGGVDYVTTLGNSFGVDARQTNGNNPTLEPIPGSTTLVDNEFTERELALVTTIVAGPQITGTARIGHTNRTHKQFPERNFSGTTWRGTVLWTPLQKTGFAFSLYHEPRSIIDIAASSVVVNGASFGPRWAPTEKLVFYALVVRERQQFKDASQIVLGTPQQDEVLRITRFGAGWEPRRFIELSAAIDHGTRVSNVFLRDYTYTAVMGNAQFKF